MKLYRRYQVGAGVLFLLSLAVYFFTLSATWCYQKGNQWTTSTETVCNVPFSWWILAIILVTVSAVLLVLSLIAKVAANPDPNSGRNLVASLVVLSLFPGVIALLFLGEVDGQAYYPCGWSNCSLYILNPMGVFLLFGSLTGALLLLAGLSPVLVKGLRGNT